MDGKQPCTAYWHIVRLMAPIGGNMDRQVDVREEESCDIMYGAVADVRYAAVLLCSD